MASTHWLKSALLLLALAPAIPTDARTITITIGNLGPSASGDRQPGPWVFPITLDPPG